jgi:hypothetical protein
MWMTLQHGFFLDALGKLVKPFLFYSPSCDILVESIEYILLNEEGVVTPV